MYYPIAPPPAFTNQGCKAVHPAFTPNWGPGFDVVRRCGAGGATVVTKRPIGAPVPPSPALAIAPAPVPVPQIGPSSQAFQPAPQQLDLPASDPGAPVVSVAAASSLRAEIKAINANIKRSQAALVKRKAQAKKFRAYLDKLIRNKAPMPVRKKAWDAINRNGRFQEEIRQHIRRLRDRLKQKKYSGLSGFDALQSLGLIGDLGACKCKRLSGLGALELEAVPDVLDPDLDGFWDSILKVGKSLIGGGSDSVSQAAANVERTRADMLIKAKEEASSVQEKLAAMKLASQQRLSDMELQLVKLKQGAGGGMKMTPAVMMAGGALAIGVLALIVKK